ncbi:glycoside hydrolase family 16 protein [Trichoderma citrinoviride]|uniref:Glycoside hydrolase family 16 protein n=1 Tax=Trichoderma citrinoviride TaxID=58853 RepID=A0A2T4AXP4_9HYPO|nr:glycoside hydrolase family 16 protein [Trichoderma citrinoviride]PTB61845.1 glycoside hydrolase family 16 protein [Trichoderma citrinoviride]
MFRLPGLGPWLALLLALMASLVVADCECGFVQDFPAEQAGDGDGTADGRLLFTHMMESKFTELRNISRDGNWKRQQYNVSARAGRGEYGKAFALKNVYTIAPDGNGEKVDADDAGPSDGIALVVGSTLVDEAIPVAELTSARADMYFGSYRAGMKLTPVNGTCAAFFWYFNDTQEIDMEFLSREFDASKDLYPVNLVIQSEASRQAGYDAAKTGTFKVVNLTFDPTAGFHEYRFDYLPNRVLFYADSKLLAEMNGTSVPSGPGHIILQHWSNGNPKWSGGPPKQDAVMTVSYVKAYFNSSDAHMQSSFAETCQKARDDDSNSGADGRVCSIPGVTASNASTGGTFFNTTDPNQPSSSGGGTEDSDSGAAHLSSTPSTAAMLLLMVALLAYS